MSKPNGVVAAFMLLLFLTSVVSPKLVVFGSSAHDDEDHEHGFKRPDPLRFKYYSGGYNVTNKHYWASAAFTGVHGYAIAAIWALSGLGFGLFVRLKSPGSGFFSDSDCCYVVMFLLVILFTVFTIVATGFVLKQNQSSLQRTNKLKNTILEAGQEMCSTIQRVINNMTLMQSQLLKYDKQTSLLLNVTIRRLGNESQTIQNFVHKNGHSIENGVHASQASHVVILSINLISVVAAIDDTCSAFEDFEQNPQNNSLSVILPCMNSTHSDEVLSNIGYIIHKFISEINKNIERVYLSFGLHQQDDGLFGSGKICDPFSAANYTYVPEKCSKNDIQIGELPNVLSGFTCYGENSIKNCRRQGKFIPQNAYDKARAYSESVQGMLDIYPDLQSLTNCTIVKTTFSEVAVNQCTSFKFSIRLLWSWMLSLSIFMVALVISWVARAWQDKGRQFSRCSIIPNPPDRL
ncbi:transmembrane protein [Citrus sinensis]|uniref:Transmembrane protein n=1 Tax=Citrus sinensis TaxID=2711 RepID=A0ACB8J632_CITSI|nr:transmembrane protein [Citrus sinensis]